MIRELSLNLASDAGHFPICRYGGQPGDRQSPWQRLPVLAVERPPFADRIAGFVDQDIQSPALPFVEIRHPRMRAFGDPAGELVSRCQEHRRGKHGVAKTVTSSKLGDASLRGLVLDLEVCDLTETGRAEQHAQLVGV